MKAPFDKDPFDETFDGLVEKAVGDAMDHALDVFDDVLDGATATTTTTTVRVTSSSGPLDIGARLLEKTKLRMQKAEARMNAARLERIRTERMSARRHTYRTDPPMPRELVVVPFTSPVVVEPEPLATYRDAPTSYELAPRPRLRVRWWHRLLCRFGHDWRAIVVVKSSYDIHSLHGFPKGLLVCTRCLRRWDRWPSDVGATRVSEVLATIRSCDVCDAYQDMPCDAAIHERENATKGAAVL